MSSPAPPPSVWDIKRRVEESNHDFAYIDISAPDFDIVDYGTRVQNLLAEANIPMDPYAVTWESLTCSVPVEPPQQAVETVVSGIRSLASAINNGFASLLPHHRAEEPAPPAAVLHDVSGYLKPGQMCLVLGQSGSGTSLLLSRIAGRRMPRLIESSGSVLYQGQERLGGVARTSHIVHFIGQDDTHIPELTVRHTLEFAASCKWPAWVPFVDVLRRNDVTLTARLLGIEGTLETIVGSNVLRGVSGGERKRVTIGEMGIGLVGGALVMDNWSKGLDSATTLSITQSMRKFADHLKGSVIVSMQAPGNEAFSLFDNLCLLHQGRLLYFGPVSKVENYFNKLGFTRPPHRTVSDFVSTIMDPHFRNDYVSGNENKELPPPETAEEFAERFTQDELAKDIMTNIEEIKRQPSFTLPPGSENVIKRGAKQTLQRPRFQIEALMRRQKNYLLSTKRTVVQEFVQNIIFGLVLGSIFWQLPDTYGGASSRDGAVFLALLFIALGSLSKVQERFDEKVVFVKQLSASFFEAWTYLLTQAVFDFLIELIKAACLFVPLYIMSGLNLGSSAQRLLYAILIATCMALTMTSMTRTFTALFDEASEAQGLLGLLVTLMILLSGYMKNGNDLEGYIVWIYWANPIHYALEAILINEFDGLKFECSNDEFLPANPAFPQDLKFCPVENGTQYLREYRGITNGKEFRLYYFLVIVGYAVVFFILSAIATTKSKPRGFAQKKPLEEADHLEAGVAVDVSETQVAKETAFTFTNIEYSVENGNKVLLSGITGNTVGGKVVLLIGTSGAGKSTLLDVCAMRKTLGHGTSMSGEIRLNGRTVGKKELARSTGYCEQNDMHAKEATVFEAVFFAAKLRLPKSISAEEKKRRTMETLSLLDMDKYSSVLVKALGAGQLKLLTMALEVVTDPKILFLDEPTSGISSSSAITVAKALRKIADSGTAVICTLHQPSNEVFSMFDRVLLLRRGGKVVYFGDIGENACVLRNYFESHGGKIMAPTDNPASWMLDVINDDTINWPELWDDSKEKEQREEETQLLSQDTGASVEFDAKEGKKYDTPSLAIQAKEVIRRQFWLYWRRPSYNGTRVTLNLMIALFIGILFLREIDNTQRGSNLAFAALFLTLVPASISATNVIPETMEGRDVFYREVSAGTYKPFAYHVAVGLVELPFTIFSTAVFAVVFYFMIGLDPARFLYFFIGIELIYVFAIMYGIMLASIFPNESLAGNVENSVFSVLMVLSGFFIRKPEMRPWWKWTTWINPLAYYLSGQVNNQFSGKVFTCNEAELRNVTRPPNFATCEDITPGKFTTITGLNGEKCNFCPTTSGDMVVQAYGADDVNKWISLVAILVAIAVFRIIAGYGFAKKRFLTR